MRSMGRQQSGIGRRSVYSSVYINHSIRIDWLAVSPRPKLQFLMLIKVVGREIMAAVMVVTIITMPNVLNLQNADI